MSANPFEQKHGQPTLKFQLWEVLAAHFPQGATVQQLTASDGPLLAACPGLRDRKSPSGQVSSELHRGEPAGHFVRQQRGNKAAWLAGTQGTPSKQPKKAKQARKAATPKPTPPTAKGQASKGVSPDGSAQPQSPEPPGARFQPGGAAGGGDEPAAGNESHTPHWKDASCSRLARSLLDGHASVWREDEGQGNFVNARITDTWTDGHMLLLRLQFADGSGVWLLPEEFEVSGRKRSTLIKVAQHRVYVKEEATGRFVPEPSRNAAPATAAGGVTEPPGLSTLEAATPPRGSAGDSPSAPAVTATAPLPRQNSAAVGSSGVAGVLASPSREQVQGRVQAEPAAALGRAATSSGSGSGSRGAAAGRPARQASGDTSNSRWWQKVVTSACPADTQDRQQSLQGSEERSVQAEAGLPQQQEQQAQTGRAQTAQQAEEQGRAVQAQQAQQAEQAQRKAVDVLATSGAARLPQQQAQEGGREAGHEQPVRGQQGQPEEQQSARPEAPVVPPASGQQGQPEEQQSAQPEAPVVPPASGQQGQPEELQLAQPEAPVVPPASGQQGQPEELQSAQPEAPVVQPASGQQGQPEELQSAQPEAPVVQPGGWQQGQPAELQSARPEAPVVQPASGQQGQPEEQQSAQLEAPASPEQLPSAEPAGPGPPAMQGAGQGRQQQQQPREVALHEALPGGERRHPEPPAAASPPAPRLDKPAWEPSLDGVQASPAPAAAVEQPQRAEPQEAAPTLPDATQPPVDASAPRSTSLPGRGRPGTAGGSAAPGRKRRQPQPPSAEEAGQRQQLPAAQPSVGPRIEARGGERGRDASRGGAAQECPSSGGALPARQHKRLGAPQQQQEAARPGAQGSRTARGGGAAPAEPFIIPKRTASVEPARAAAQEAAMAPAQPAKASPFRIPKAGRASSTPAPSAAVDVARGGARSPAKRGREASDPLADAGQKQRRGDGGSRVPSSSPPQQAPQGPSPPAGLQRSAERPIPSDSFSDTLLLSCSSALVRRGREVRWSRPPCLPRPATGSATGAEPHLVALQQRLAAAAAGSWHSLLSSLPRQALAQRRQLPQGIVRGRIFVSKRDTLSFSMQRGIFASNNRLDVHGLEAGMLALMHSLDEKVVYGCFKVEDWGWRLDPGFPKDFGNHVQVAPLCLFQPVPAEFLDCVCKRMIDPRTGKQMKFFEKHLDLAQCEQIWSMLAHYDGKLDRDLDTPSRFGSEFGKGWEGLLAAQRSSSAATSAALPGPSSTTRLYAF